MSFELNNMGCCGSDTGFLIFDKLETKIACDTEVESFDQVL